MLVAVLATLGCSDSFRPELINDGDTSGAQGGISCSIPRSEIFSGGVGRDGIPALTDPTLVDVGSQQVAYLLDADRVIGIELENEYIAVPHNILWWHEIVNLDRDDRRIAVTYCPLTGSSLTFDRTAAGDVEFGVSGLLYQNNLIMYDRNPEASLWPQMSRGARCGPRDGTDLGMYPAQEMTWKAWRTLHPDTKVISQDTGYGRNYRIYPYGSYEDVDNAETLFPMPYMDPRRPPKERVLGIPAEQAGGIAFPFGVLDQKGALSVVQDEVEGDPFVVFWSRESQAAAAFWPIVDGAHHTFTVDGLAIVDLETSSSWGIDGVAYAGPLEGSRLIPVEEAHVAFWFAWAGFHSATRVWLG